jgi:hypothetical protein
MPFARYQSPVVEDDLAERLLAGEHRREQDPVVVGMRLGAEDGDLAEVWRDPEQLLEGAHAGHAVADQHQALALPARWRRAGV